VDHFIANSKNVARRIQKYYGRQAEVIHPPVDTQFFQPADRKQDYYLIVSALVPYKRIDLAIEAFNRTGEALKIVGQGPEYKKLKKQSKVNIEFLGSLEAKNLLLMYQGARALILPGEEDFGITSLESQACGIPVIAYGKGGCLETVLPTQTGLFFDELRVESVLEILDKFRGMEFNKTKVRENALHFSRDKFKERVRASFLQKWTKHKKQT